MKKIDTKNTKFSRRTRSLFYFFVFFSIFGFFVLKNARAQDVSVETFCRLLPEYHEPAGVEYQPGVGPNGPVAPADVNGGTASLPQFDSIEIPVTQDLIRQFHPDVPRGTELKPYVALMSIHKDGRVDYNGQDISKQAYDLCKNNK